jgi:hypothetical protein
VEKYDRVRQAAGDNIIQRMRFACWITKVTGTHSEYEILIAFPRQKWLRERALVLRLHVHFLSCLFETAEVEYLFLVCPKKYLLVRL